MSITVLGNRGPAHKTQAPVGVGIANFPQGVGWCSVCASDAGEAYIELTGLINSSLNLGVFIQGEGDITLDFTLSPAAMATNPDPKIQDSVLWSNTLVPDGTIQNVDILFNVMRVKFAGPGEFYVIAR